MWFCVISLFQFFCSCLRNSWLNGPAYDRNPVASRTSPTSRLICASKPLLAAVHLIFSPDKPSINAVAMFILRRHAFASSTNACISNHSLLTARRTVGLRQIKNIDMMPGPKRLSRKLLDTYYSSETFY